MGNKPSSCSSDEGAKATTNRPFPSSKKSHFQNEAKCEAIDMEITFNYYANKTHFHNKGFALSLVLKLRFFGTRKWPIKEYRRVGAEEEVKSTSSPLLLFGGYINCIQKQPFILYFHFMTIVGRLLV